MAELTTADILNIQLEMVAGVLPGIFEFESHLSQMFGPTKPYSPPTPDPEVLEMATLLGIEASPYYSCEQEMVGRFVAWCEAKLPDWRTNPQLKLFWECFDTGRETAQEDEDY